MKILSLKKVFNNILTEAQLDQTNFLASLFPIAKKNPLSKGEENTAIYNIMKSVEETGLIDLEKGELALKGKVNKKARNAANLKIHKDLQVIKGTDGESINLKQMRPLYGSMIEYLEGKKEVSINDCLIAADFFMKEFYDVVDEKEKQLIDDGKFDFSKVFQITKFYQSFSEFKKEMGFFEDSAIKIFEDEQVKVVYPSNSDSFNTYIDSSGCSVDWCTQSPSTWDSYNKRQFVMIMTDKSSKDIISLKVNHDGSIDYYGTCDVYNMHMDETAIRRMLSDKAHDVIKNQVFSLDLINTTASVEFTLEEFEEQVLGLLEINNAQEIKGLFLKIKDNDSGMFEELSDSLFKNAFKLNKVDFCINLYTDLISSIVFNDTTKWERNESWLYCLERNKIINKFVESLVENSLNKRNHVKYFTTLNSLFIYNNKEAITNINDIENKIKSMAFTSLNKSNILNFKKVLTSIAEYDFARNILLKKDNFPEIFRTRGFKSYFEQKKGNVISPTKILTYIANISESDKLLTNIILNNKEKFKLSIQDELSQESNSITSKDVDFGLITKIILNKNQSGIYDVKKMELKKLFPYMIELSKSDIDKVENTIYTDLKLVENLSNKSNKLKLVLLEHFFTTVDNFGHLKNKKNDSIVFDEKSYNVFTYLFNKSVTLNNIRDHPKRTFFYVSEILELILKFGKDLNSVDSGIKKVLVEKSSSLWHSLFEYSHLKEQSINKDLEDMIVELANEASLDVKSLFSFRSYILKNNLFSKKDKHDYRQSLVDRIFSNENVNNFFVNILQSENINIGDIYCLFYLLINKKINLSIEQSSKLIVSYINSIAKRNIAKILKAGTHPYLSHEVFRSINKLIASTMVIDHGSTKSIGRFIDEAIYFNDAFFPFRDLSIQLMKKCEKENIPFSKEDIALVISSPRFKNFPEDIRRIFLNNFISIGSDGTKNNLEMKDRVTIRNTLKSGIKDGNHLVKDKTFIIDLCKMLDNYSQFQMSIIFPEEKSLRKSPGSANEELLRKYLRLILN